MNDFNKEITRFSGLVFVGYLLGFLSLLVPVTVMTFNGQKVFQYPISGYLGQVVFGLILVAAALSFYPVLRKNKSRTWPCLPAGLILLGYSMAEFQQVVGIFEPIENNLTQVSQATISLYIGWYGCCVAGLILFIKWSSGRNADQKLTGSIRSPH